MSSPGKSPVMAASVKHTHHDKGDTHRSPLHDRGKDRKCIPKKDGAGGLGAWGKAGEELDIPEPDEGDPMYDEEAALHAVLEQAKENTRKLLNTHTHAHTHGGEASEEEISTALTPVILEYFENADNTDVFELAAKINFGHRRHLMVKLIVEIGVDHNDDVRELCSQLISDLFGKKFLSSGDVMHGFDVVLTEAGDLKLDAPDAPDVLGKFLARAVADDCLPPAYVDSHPANNGDFGDAVAHAAMKKAHTLLHMSHAMSHLDQVWGVHGQRKPVKYLIREIILCIKEYLSSNDLKEAEKCLHELGVPHFHHEVVYEAVMIVMEKEQSLEQVMQLLHHLYDAGFITLDQMTTGLRRIHTSLADISLDVPRAREIFHQVSERGRALGFISAHLSETLESPISPSP